MDNHTPEQRRKNMQAIHSKDTEIEVILRKELWKRGLRYRKNCKDLPGKPDIAFKGKKVAIFCDSEFWHGYDWENQKERIGTKREYWIPKIERNMERDRKVEAQLEQMGYTVLRFWRKKIIKNTEECADSIEKTLNRSRCW
ncbi:MAG: very short patch repair endonuclease [Thermoplasmata archaeon]|nr:very short patch repair endonuclease [Thermoplasmata archaeon]MBE6523904.1 very short patch repair endonuclease [Thermoplasmata archaeon]